MAVLVQILIDAEAQRRAEKMRDNTKVERIATCRKAAERVYETPNLVQSSVTPMRENDDEYVLP
jgi:hypothetical protein